VSYDLLLTFGFFKLRPPGDVRTILYGLTGMLLILGVARLPSMPGKLMSFMVLLGNASYSLYLVHWSLYEALARVFDKLSLHDTLGVGFTCLIIFLVSVAAGLIFYLVVEKPLMLFFRRFSPKKVVATV
jgi:peptidoglycan/LPS O-acetylase OafA/YrhL